MRNACNICGGSREEGDIYCPYCSHLRRLEKLIARYRKALQKLKDEPGCSRCEEAAEALEGELV